MSFTLPELSRIMFARISHNRDDSGIVYVVKYHST